MEDPAPLRLTFTPFELDETNARLSHDGKAVPLTPRALAVLCVLARQPGKLITKGDLLDSVWGHRHVSESVLKTVVSELRTVLGDDAKQPRFIETVPRRGYRFIAALGTGANASDPAAGSTPALQGSKPPAQAGERSGDGEPDKSNIGLARPIGRRAELARVLAGWTRVARGACAAEGPPALGGAGAVASARRIVWITGEAGIGKTTLIDLLAAEANPARIARGHCVEQFGSGEPYLPVLEALGGLCRVDSGLQSLMRSVAPAWLIQMPWLCSEAERVDLQRELSGSHPDRMLREFCELLDRFTHSEPLLLVSEDLHWSDHATIRLIDYFARSRGPARVLWLGSFRPADVIAAEHPLTGVRHELRVSGLCDEVALDPFSEREVADYLAGRFPVARAATTTTATESFVRSLHATTDGLPLFVVNVVDDLMSQGALTEGGAGAFPRSVSQVPESVAGVIERRITRLAPELQSLLEVAAVCGVEFRSAMLAQAIEREPEWVVEGCESLVQRQYWLRHVGIGQLADGSLDVRYRFRHALYREVFYSRIGAHAKTSLHRRLARSLEQSRIAGEDVPAAEIAVHFDLGHDPLQAVRHYDAAAESALERFASVEAEQLIERATDLLPRCPAGDERLGLELMLAMRRVTAGALLGGFGTAGARATLERARSLCDVLPQSPELAWVAIWIGWVYFQRGDYMRARSLAGRARAFASSHDDPAMLVGACDLAGASAALQGEPGESLRLLEQGMAACERAQGRFPKVHLQILDPLVSMHSAISTPLCQLGLFDRARRHVEVALRRTEALGGPLSRMLAYQYAGALEVSAGRPAQAREWADALERLTREHGLPSAEGPGLWLRGWALVQDGEVEAGLALIEQGRASRERIGLLTGITYPVVLAAETMVLAGRWAMARELIDEGLRSAERLGERVHVPKLLIERARAAIGTGDTETARGFLLESLRLARTQGALLLEHLALEALCELDGDASEHLGELREARGRLREAVAAPLAASTQHLLSCVGLDLDTLAAEERPRAA